MAVTRAMLMAAGLGTRLRPFTEQEPKALMPLMGIPIAQFAVDAITRAGVSQLVANIHHHAVKARRGIEALERGQAELILSDESELLLGSAGGLRKALSHFEGQPFFLVNADVLCDVDLLELAKAHEKLRGQWDVTMTLAVFPEPPTTGKYREIYLDHETGLVRGFSPDQRTGRPFFIGSAVLEEAALRDVPLTGSSEFVPTILEPMVRERKVGFHLTQGIWKDVGSPQLWLDAHVFLIRALETGRMPKCWRERLDERNFRISNEVWVSCESWKENGLRLRRQVTNWAGPCYFSGEEPPAILGPNAVLYGPAPSDSKLQNGIALGGHQALCM